MILSVPECCTVMVSFLLIEPTMQVTDEFLKSYFENHFGQTISVTVKKMMKSRHKLSGFAFAEFNFSIDGLNAAIRACEESLHFHGIKLQCKLSHDFLKFINHLTNNNFGLWVTEVGACTSVQIPLKKTYNPPREMQLLQFSYVFMPSNTDHAKINAASVSQSSEQSVTATKNIDEFHNERAPLLKKGIILPHSEPYQHNSEKIIFAGNGVITREMSCMKVPLQSQIPTDDESCTPQFVNESMPHFSNMMPILMVSSEFFHDHDMSCAFPMLVPLHRILSYNACRIASAAIVYEVSELEYLHSVPHWSPRNSHYPLFITR